MIRRSVICFLNEHLVLIICNLKCINPETIKVNIPGGFLISCPLIISHKERAGFDKGHMFAFRVKKVGESSNNDQCNDTRCHYKNRYSKSFRILPRCEPFGITKL